MIDQNMNSEIYKDIGEIYNRIFSHKPFLSSELPFFVKEFEIKRGDREVDNLFSALQTTVETKDYTIPRVIAGFKSRLPQFQKNIEKTLSTCEDLLKEKPDTSLQAALEENREIRKTALEKHIKEIENEYAKIDLIFQEKEKEISESFLVLERRLNIIK